MDTVSHRRTRAHLDWQLLLVSYMLALFGIINIAIATFDPDKGDFVPYAMDQLCRELRSMDTPLARYGITGAPRSFGAGDQMSLDCPDADYGFPAYAAA